MARNEERKRYRQFIKRRYRRSNSKWSKSSRRLGGAIFEAGKEAVKDAVVAGAKNALMS